MSAGRLSKQKASFTQVPNALIADERLTLKAKGLYCLISSKPEGWVFREGALICESRDGRDGFRTAVEELIKYSWLQKVKVKDRRGRFVRMDWYLSFDGKPLLGVVFSAKSGGGNVGGSMDGFSGDGKTVDGKTGGRKSRPLSNTKGSNTKGSNTEFSSEEDFKVENRPRGRPKGAELRGETFAAWCGRNGHRGVPAAWEQFGVITLRMAQADPRQIGRQVERFEARYLRGERKGWLSEDWPNEFNRWLKMADGNRKDRGRPVA